MDDNRPALSGDDAKKILNAIIENLHVASRISDVIQYLLYVGATRENLLALNYNIEDIDRAEKDMGDYVCTLTF